jgi:NTE family protein
VTGRALVLGAGGNAAIAWEVGVLAGLLDVGIDVRTADVVIGTSAGSVVGAPQRRRPLGVSPRLDGRSA